MIKEMQFAAVWQLLLLTLTLMFMLFRRNAVDSVANRSRWMMAGGTSLLGVQFLLQYSLGLREMGVTQAVMLNLLFFVPCSWLFCLSVLYLQRRGALKRKEWCAGGVVWAAVIVLIAGASIIDRKPLLCDTHEMRMAELIGAGLYLAVQCYYTYLLLTGMRRLKQSLSNYYDRDMEDVLRWMNYSIWMLASSSIIAPFAIFSQGRLLSAFALFFLFCIYYLVHTFKNYVMSKSSARVMEAQQNASDSGLDDEEDSPSGFSSNEIQKAEQAIAQWTATGSYLRSGITMSTVASEMHLPQPLLRAWFHAAGYESYPDWMQHLRIEHAKQLIKEHPEWSLESIAEHCGFSSRNYFHKIFLKLEGKTPAQFAGQLPKA